jgi:hypothetical protein
MESVLTWDTRDEGMLRHERWRIEDKRMEWDIVLNHVVNLKPPRVCC